MDIVKFFETKYKRELTLDEKQIAIGSFEVGKKFGIIKIIKKIKNDYIKVMRT